MNILTLDTEVYGHMYIHDKMKDLVKAGLINSHHLTFRICNCTITPYGPHDSSYSQPHNIIAILLYDYIITECNPSHVHTSTTLVCMKPSTLIQ